MFPLVVGLSHCRVRKRLSHVREYAILTPSLTRPKRLGLRPGTPWGRGESVSLRWPGSHRGTPAASSPNPLRDRMIEERTALPLGQGEGSPAASRSLPAQGSLKVSLAMAYPRNRETA